MSHRKLLWLLPLSLLAACSNANNERTSFTKQRADGQSVQADTAEAAAGSPINSPDRKIIHTANIHCRVPDVLSAVSQLEQLARSLGGIVQDSHIQNSADEMKTSFCTKDSLKQTQTYTTTATMILRVPVRYTDTVLQAIPRMSAFIESRDISQTDVTFQYLANELKNSIGDNSGSVPLPRAKKTTDAITADQYVRNREEQSISREMENRQLDDQVAYATVNVALSQPQRVYTQVIADPNFITTQPLRLRAEEALYNGWAIVSWLIVALLTIWPLLAISSIAAIILVILRSKHIAVVKKV